SEQPIASNKDGTTGQQPPDTNTEPEPKSELRVDPKIENKVKAKVEPKVEPKVEMKIEPKGVSKPDLVPVGELRQFVGHRGRVTGVAFSSDGSKVFTSCYDQTVRSWDAKTGKEVGRFEGVQTRVHSLAVSRDGSRIVAGT